MIIISNIYLIRKIYNLKNYYLNVEDITHLNEMEAKLLEQLGNVSFEQNQELILHSIENIINTAVDTENKENKWIGEIKNRYNLSDQIVNNICLQIAEQPIMKKRKLLQQTLTLAFYNYLAKNDSKYLSCYSSSFLSVPLPLIPLLTGISAFLKLHKT